MMKLASVLATLALATSVAHADDAPSQKDPVVATALSLGGTLASAGLIFGSHSTGAVELGLYSSLVTPSLGEWYAGKYLTVGMGIRAASVGVMIAGLASGVCIDGCESGESNSGWGLLLLGLGGYATGAIYDIATAHSAANDWNAKHAVTIAPTMLPNHGMGVGLAGRF